MRSSTNLYGSGASQSASPRNSELSVENTNAVSVQEIVSRLLERAKSQGSSHHGRKAHSKLALPVVHESIYVYASDKENGGMILAEKWNLTLEQASIPRNRPRRNSYLAGVEPTPESGESHG